MLRHGSSRTQPPLRRPCKSDSEEYAQGIEADIEETGMTSGNGALGYLYASGQQQGEHQRPAPAPPNKRRCAAERRVKKDIDDRVGRNRVTT